MQTATTTVSFPGLGIGEFTVDRVAFSIFGKDVYWYGVIIMLGMVIAFVHAYLRSKQEGITADDILDIGIWTVVSGVLGARLYYVFFDFLKRPENYEGFVDFIAVWDGGLAIYGGVICGTLAVFLVSRFKKINFLKALDCVAPGVMIAQAMGRWGNFFNGEAYGRVVPEGSLLYRFRMGLISDYTVPYMQYYHPTFLYESLWNLVGFILITVFYRKKKFNGQIVLSYFTWYGFGRMFIEGLRTDSLYIGPFRVSQLIGGACFVCGLGLIITCLVLQKKGKWSDILTVRWAEKDPAGAPTTGSGQKDADKPADKPQATDETDTPDSGNNSTTQTKENN